MDLINADTGEVLCHSEPRYGQALAPMDEQDYITGVDVCLWGCARKPGATRRTGSWPTSSGA